MKRIYIISLFIVSIFAFTSCEKDETENVSDITYYPEVELLGDPLILVEQGTEFNDPGINATIQGEEVEYETVTNLDTSTPGKYSISYEVTNDDGFTFTANRTVFVYENNGSIAGFWHGSSGNGSGFPILISSTNDPNVFDITDILVGHYEYGVNYGPAYAAPSTLNYDGTTLSSPGGPNGFGMWTVDGPSISADETTMTWGATLVGQGFALSGLQLDKVTP